MESTWFYVVSNSAVFSIRFSASESTELRYTSWGCFLSIRLFMTLIFHSLCICRTSLVRKLSSVLSRFASKVFVVMVCFLCRLNLLMSEGGVILSSYSSHAGCFPLAWDVVPSWSARMRLCLYMFSVTGKAFIAQINKGMIIIL